MDGIDWEKEEAPKSAISCATACYENENCTQGWSYQQATARCLFIAADIGTEEMDKLQPNGQIMETDRTVGWATGLKACWRAREFLILLIFSLMIGLEGVIKKNTIKNSTLKIFKNVSPNGKTNF